VPKPKFVLRRTLAAILVGGLAACGGGGSDSTADMSAQEMPNGPTAKALAVNDAKFAIPASAVTASAHDGNVPANTVDANLSTRWAAQGDGQWIRYDLGAVKTVGQVRIAWNKGSERRATFDVQVSGDGNSWTNLLTRKQSSGSTSALETYDVTDSPGRYVRIVGHGNTQNDWNSIWETQVWGTGAGGCSAVPALLKSTFVVEGPNPYAADGCSIVFEAMVAKVETPNGNGWRHELKLDEPLRKGMTQIYEALRADIKVNLSKGGKTIITQYHAEGTGTIVKVYVADTSESGFINSVAKDGIFDVYARIKPAGSSTEIKMGLGTITTGGTFNLSVINNRGDVSVSAFGRTLNSRVDDGGASYLKFGDYLQSQDPVTNEKCGPPFAPCYAAFGIAESKVTMSNITYSRQ